MTEVNFKTEKQDWVKEESARRLYILLTLQPKYMVLVQSTGLKDKNGRLIYKGDIIEDLDNNIYEVQFSLNQASFIFRARKPIDNPKYDIFPAWDDGYDSFKVLGNIYENLELLEENNK